MAASALTTATFAAPTPGAASSQRPAQEPVASTVPTTSATTAPSTTSAPVTTSTTTTAPTPTSAPGGSSGTTTTAPTGTGAGGPSGGSIRTPSGGSSSGGSVGGTDTSGVRPFDPTSDEGGGTVMKAAYDEIIGQEADLVARLNSARAEQTRLTDQLNALQAKLTNSVSNKASAQKQLVAAEAQVKRETAARKTAERRVVEAKDRLREQIVASYVTGGDNSGLIQALLDAHTGEDAGNAIAYSRAIVGDTDRLVHELEDARAERRRADGAAKRARSRAATRRDDVTEAAAAVAKARDEQAELVESVKLQTAVASAALSDVQGRKALMEGQIASMNRTSDSVAAILAGLSGKQPPWRPGAVLATNPIPGYSIGSKFGQRRHPILGTTRLHAGGDLGAPSGTTIYAAADGVVVSAGVRGGYGNATVIEHGHSLATLYGHQSRIDVRPGQIVRRGDPIGAVGSTGLSTGPHLHFETRIKGVPVDPETVVDFTLPKTSYEDERKAALDAITALLVPGSGTTTTTAPGN